MRPAPPRSSLLRQALPALLLGTAFVSCRSSPRAMDDQAPATDVASGGSEGDRPLEVRVDNQHTRDVEIFLVVAGQRRRLGTLAPRTAEVLRFPASLAANGRSIALAARAHGASRLLYSAATTVQPDQQLQWTLYLDLRREFLSVR